LDCKLSLGVQWRSDGSGGGVTSGPEPGGGLKVGEVQILTKFRPPIDKVSRQRTEGEVAKNEKNGGEVAPLTICYIIAAIILHIQ
jgi:hypothetical protein